MADIVAVYIITTVVFMIDVVRSFLPIQSGFSRGTVPGDGSDETVILQN